MNDIAQIEHVQIGSRRADSEERTRRKSHKAQKRPPFECIALLLQGGGALGAYQAGVYQALSEAHLNPDWVAGISIVGINAAIIAGNPSGTVPRSPCFARSPTTKSTTSCS